MARLPRHFNCVCPMLKCLTEQGLFFIASPCCPVHRLLRCPHTCWCGYQMTDELRVGMFDWGSHEAGSLTTVQLCSIFKRQMWWALSRSFRS
jgi:hypothetical protein